MPANYLQERFQELPLFQGMSRTDITNALETFKPTRITCAKGRVIINEGDVCDSLYFVLDGSVNISTTADDHGYTLTEEITAPNIIQPENIFGLNQRFTCSVAAATNCELIGIGKHDVVMMSDKYEIFRLNLLNIICTRAQRRNRFPWRTKPNGVRQKIVRFIEFHSLRPAGTKALNITMERLAHEIGESRLNVSKELKRMKNENLISLHRCEITIPALEKIIR